MTTLELLGRITENGDLTIQLPPGLPTGDVTVRIDLPETTDSAEAQSWSDEELQELVGLMTPAPKTGAEIVAWLKANPSPDLNWGGITDDSDVAEYVHNMRRTKHSAWGQAE